MGGKVSAKLAERPDIPRGYHWHYRQVDGVRSLAAFAVLRAAWDREDVDDIGVCQANVWEKFKLHGAAIECFR